jgi:hypothetical protein
MPRAFGVLAINALGPFAPRLPGQRNHLRIELRMAFARRCGARRLDCPAAAFLDVQSAFVPDRKTHKREKPMETAHGTYVTEKPGTGRIRRLGKMRHDFAGEQTQRTFEQLGRNAGHLHSQHEFRWIELLLEFANPFLCQLRVADNEP